MEQPPSRPSNPILGWIRASRRNSIIAAVVAVLLVCSCCSLGLNAVRGSGGGTTGGQQVNVSATSTLAGPTATPRPTATATATPKPKSWQTVQHWSGTSNEQSPTFSLPDGSRIVWSFQLQDSANLFVLELDDAQFGTPIDLIEDDANVSQGKSGTYNVHGDHQAYIKIQADSVSYDVAVQVYR